MADKLGFVNTEVIVRGIVLGAVINIAFGVQAFGQIPALSAKLGFIGGVAADAHGNVFMALSNANVVVRVDPEGILTVAAGNGTRGNSGDDGPATLAQLSLPVAVAIGPTGNLYIADGNGSQIRMVSNGVITTVAGGGSDFESDNIPAMNARLSVPYGNGIAVDAAGNLYIASFFRIRKVSNGLITTMFDGSSTFPLVLPNNIALDAAGNFYFTDPCVARVFKLSNGTLTTVAGTGIPVGFGCAPAASSGDGGPATSASLYNPGAITLDATGAVYVTEQNPAGGWVRRISNGIITAFAGGGPNVIGPGTSDNIPATSAFLINTGADIAADTAGNLYIGDSYHFTATGRLRKVSGGIITTVAGSEGSVCPNEFLVNVSPALFPVSGGNGHATFVINADPSCGWTVTGLPAWIAGQGSGTGPASVELSVLANPGAARSATFQIAGFFVTVSQAACTYSLDAGGQSFSAQGGTGTITITTGAGCPWTAGTPPAGVAFTSTTSGAGSGAVSYQVFPTSGGASSGAITIAGQSFTVEQQAASIPSLGFIGSMPHIAAEENWTTTFTIVNNTGSSNQVRFSLLGSNIDASGSGNSLQLPLNLPQQASLGVLLGASLDNMLSPNASWIVSTAGQGITPVQTGSAQVSATGALGGFAIFHRLSDAQEAVVPLTPAIPNAPAYLLVFDNTDGIVTAVAIANVSAQSANIGYIIRDDTGAQIGSGTLTAMPGNGQISFVLPDAVTGFPVTADRRGTIEFDTPLGGQISVLGIRNTPQVTAQGTVTTLTTVPALANVGSGGGSFAHLASGDGWQTTFVLVNAGTSAAQFTLRFLADQTGVPMSLPLSFPQPSGGAPTAAPSVTQNLAAGATLVIVSSGAPQLLTGSAQLSTTGHVSGFVIFRHNGQEAVVPLESRNARTYLIAFDNTNGTATGIAVNAVSAGQVNIPVTVRDDTGALIATDTITLSANGHYAFTLVTGRYKATTNIRGTVEFDAPAGAQIGALGIRIPAGAARTYTTLPALAK